MLGGVVQSTVIVQLYKCHEFYRYLTTSLIYLYYSVIYVILRIVYTVEGCKPVWYINTL